MKLTYILTFLLVGGLALSSFAQIRGAKRLTIGKMRDMSRDAGSSVGGMAKEEMQSYEAGMRTNIQGLKKGAPNRALGFFNAQDTNPNLEVLIEDEQARASIEDRRNKERFVELLYEWWLLPSDFDLAEKRRLALELLKNKLAPKSGYMHQKKIKDNEVIVFTWHPTWYDKAYKEYHYDRVNVISYYSYDIDPGSGFPLNPNAIEDFLKTDGMVAHVKNTPRIKSYGDEKIIKPDTSYAKILLSVSLHGEENVRNFLAPENKLAQQEAMAQIMRLVDSMKIDGIELNILNVPADSRGEFYKFLAQISNRIHNSRPDRLVFLSIPPFDRQKVYDFAELTPFIDYFIILAIDFHLQAEDGEIAKGPLAPLNLRTADQALDIRKSVGQIIRKIGTYNADRVILALPNFGMMWVSQGADEIPMQQYTYDELMTTYINTDDSFDTVRFDISRYTNIWQYIDAKDTLSLPIRTEIYFDNIDTWRLKYKFALDARLGGVGLHMLGDIQQYSAEHNALLDEVFSEYVEPSTSMFAKADKASSTSQGVAMYVFAVLLYWGIFMVIGFVWALFDYQTRQSLFDTPRFRTMYLAFFVTLLIMLGNYFGLFQYNVALLIVGLALGSFMSWSILKSLYQQQADQP
jgi:spore germination protein YaaH